MELTLEEKEKFYESCVRRLPGITTKRDYERMIYDLERLDGLKDSAKYIEECREKIKEIEEAEAKEAEIRNREYGETVDRLQAEAKKENKKANLQKLLVVVAAVVILTILVVLYKFFLYRPLTYNTANTYIQNGYYEEAATLLEDLNYKDSDELYQECLKHVGE